MSFDSKHTLTWISLFALGPLAGTAIYKTLIAPARRLLAAREKREMRLLSAQLGTTDDIISGDVVACYVGEYDKKNRLHCVGYLSGDCGGELGIDVVGRDDHNIIPRLDVTARLVPAAEVAHARLGALGSAPFLWETANGDFLCQKFGGKYSYVALNTKSHGTVSAKKFQFGTLCALVPRTDACAVRPLSS